MKDRFTNVDFRGAWKTLLHKWDSYRSHDCPSHAWWGSFILVTVLSVVTRIGFVQRPPMVIWDETHFGKMINWYMNGTFFLDVHPKGGKLLLSLFGYISGYNGTFSFQGPGTDMSGFPEVFIIRALCSLLGASLVPMAFWVAWTITKRLPAAVIASSLIAFELGTIMLSKFILLDSPLMFFMMASIVGLVKLHHAQERHGSFSTQWWAGLFLTGAMVGAVLSVKFVGLFTVAAVGLYTIHSLWIIFPSASMVDLLRHVLSRVLCLILLPVAIYIACFIVHDSLLYQRHDENEPYLSYFSPNFQMTFAGAKLHNVSQPKYVTYGSNVTLKNTRVGSGHLAPTNLTFPYSVLPTKDFVVGTTRGKHHMNHIQIYYPYDDPDLADGLYSGEQDVVRHGDVVRLFNPHYGLFLACNRSAAATARTHRIAYATAHPGRNSTEDNHLWAVYVKGAKNETGKWSVIESSVSFYNEDCRCFLSLNGQNYPKWGQRQKEISCAKTSDDTGALWYAEQSHNPHAANGSFQHLASGFVDRFFETHEKMFWMNSRFTPILTGHMDVHQPWTWFFCLRSHPWYSKNYFLVLLGNPFVFWLNGIGFVGVLVFLGAQCYQAKRNPKADRDPELQGLVFWCWWLLVAYLLHYVPFFFMDRVVYYHHYFPALQLSCLLTGVFVGSMVSRCESSRVSLSLMTAVLLLTVVGFGLFCHTGYGVYSDEDSNNRTSSNLRWFERWEDV